MYNILLCLFLMLLITCSIPSMAVSETNMTDQSTLLHFKSYITSDPLNILTTNWSTSTSFCNWIGVTCNSRHHGVAVLDLSNMGLEGTISPHLGNLSFLVYLNLSSNMFHGRLPDELANLRRVVSIDMSNNSISGVVPSGFASLLQLQDLIVSNNNLTGTIPRSLFGISGLKTLDMSYNKLFGRISKEIGKLASLRKLALSSNQFYGSIPDSLLNISTLQIVYLQFNNFSGNLPLEICNENWTNLEEINLDRNELYGRIPASLFRCKKLRVFGVNGNNFTGAIPRDIGNLRELDELVLGKNNFQGSIPREIRYLVKLRVLGLAENSFEGIIPQEISNLTQLEKLSLRRNHFEGHFPEVGNLKKLDLLDLGRNYLSGSIPSYISNMSRLITLSVSFNNLSGNLPHDLGLYLPRLQNLYLNDNAFTGPIPDTISNASQLISLELANNFFSGNIPNSLGNLPNLQWLNLLENSLSSTPEASFFSSLVNTKSLVMLSLSQNPLNGFIPNSVGNISTNLQYFYVAKCNLTGGIPTEMSNLSSLISIILEGNRLNGTVPTALSKLQNLQALNLNHNKLKGQIPNGLCSLTNMVYLELDDNMLSGSVPSCLSKLTSLRELILGSNKLTGSIPSGLWNMQDILKINLSSNSLIGSLPSQLGLKALVSLDLSSNQLSSDVPSGISSLLNLASLNLSRNRFQGHIPELFGDLVALEYLDLSRNRLSGAIPKSLEKLLYLKNLNLSYNQLEGEIPDKGPFKTFSIQSFMGNNDLCSFGTQLQVRRCKISSVGKHTNASRIALFQYVLPTVGFIILVLAFLTIFFKYRKRSKKAEDVQPLATWKRISQHELQQSTNKFHEDNLVGVGSFGSVYKGTLVDGTTIAVKVFNLQLEEKAEESFDTECEVLGQLRHRNLVRILTSCSSPDFKALVLDFLPNWSLDKWLHSTDIVLDIQQRLSIVIDIASALEYLHHSCTHPVVHCDLKPSNVLLDENMVAYVSDFGLAKLLGDGSSVKQTLTLATVGYMAPEYGSEGIISTKVDVYSFGILLMETFTGRRPTDEMFDERMSIKNWVQNSLIEPNGLFQIVDADISITDQRDERRVLATKNCITYVMRLSVECCADLVERRREMEHVVVALKKIRLRFLKETGVRNP